MKYVWYLIGLLLPWYVIRFSIWGIPNNLFEVVAIGGILGYGLTRWRQTWKIIGAALRSPMWIGFLILSGVGILSSHQLLDSLGIWKSFFVVPGLLGVIAWQDTQVRIGILRGLVGSALVLSCWVLGEVILAGSLSYRPTAWFDLGIDPNLTRGGFANYIGLYLVPISMMVGIPGVLPSKRVQIVATIVMWGGILSSQSYTALGAILGTLGVASLCWIRCRKTQINITRTMILAGISVGVIIFSFGIWQAQTEKFQNLFDMSQRNSLSSRVQIWHTSIEIIRSNPLLGVGHADFPQVYVDTIPELYFPPHEWLVPEPHNLYLAFWVHTGVLGGIWIGGIVWQTLRVLRSSQWQYGLPMLSVLTYGLFDTPFWKNDLAVIFILAWVLLLGVFKVRKSSEDLA